MVIAEAMACGTPVIAARAGALPVVAGHAGRLFPAGDAPALARHLREVMESDRERERMTRLGREQARRYTWEISARKFEATLREAVTGSVSQRARSQLGALKSIRRWLSR